MDEKKKLRIGIIGCGKIAQVRHAPEYAENAACMLTGFYDICAGRAEEMAAQYGGVAASSLEELFSLGLDAVSVCNANAVHAQSCTQALHAGCHVLCEKPMALTAEECEAIIEAQEQTGRYVMVAQNQRFNEAHRMARGLLASGKLGRPICFHTCFGHSGPENWTGQKDSWFMQKSLSGFGAVADLGVHKIDLMHYLLGTHFTEVAGVYETLDKKDGNGAPISVDDNAFCILKDDHGVIGQMHVSWTLYGQENNATVIYCTGGVIRCYDDPKDSLIVEYENGTTERFSPDAMMTNDGQNEGKRTSTGVIDAFISSILTKTPPEIDAKEAYAALKVVFALEKSNREKRWISLKEKG